MSVAQARSNPGDTGRTSSGPPGKKPRNPKTWLTATAAVLVVSVVFLWPATQVGGQQIPTQVSEATQQNGASPTAPTITSPEPQVTTARAITEAKAQSKVALAAATSTQTAAHCLQDHSGDGSDHNTECSENHDADPAAHAADCANNHSTEGSDHDSDCSEDHTHGSDHHAHGPDGSDEHAHGSDHADATAHAADCANNHSGDSLDQHSDCTNSSGTSSSGTN